MVNFILYKYVIVSCFSIYYYSHMFSKLHNLYWFIRYTRNPSTKRRYYRYVEKEKKRLLEAGADPEELRLLCRTLSARLNYHAEKRLAAYRKNQIDDQTSS